MTWTRVACHLKYYSSGWRHLPAETIYIYIWNGFNLHTLGRSM